MKKSLLLVDDDREYTGSMKTGLEKSGYRILVANNGWEAMETARRDKPDAILLDIMMPGKDGGDVAQDLRGDKKLSDIPVIFLTSLMKRDEMRPDRKGRTGERCVAKTAPFDRLLAEIEDALAGEA